MFLNHAEQLFRGGQVAGVCAAMKPEDFAVRPYQRRSGQLPDVALFLERAAEAYTRTCLFGLLAAALEIGGGKKDFPERRPAESHGPIAFLMSVGETPVLKAVLAAELSGAFGICLHDAGKLHTPPFKGWQPLAQLRE